MSRKWDKASPVEDDDSEEPTHEMYAWHLGWLKEAFRVLRPGGVIKIFSATRTFHRLAAAMEQVGFILEPGKSFEAWVQGQGFPKSLNIEKAIDAYLDASDQRRVVGHKRGVGGENLNDLVNETPVIRQTTDAGGKGVGAYGTGAKQIPVVLPVTEPATPEAKQFQGYGTALKPAWEIFVVGRKPL